MNAYVNSSHKGKDHRDRQLSCSFAPRDPYVSMCILTGVFHVFFYSQVCEGACWISLHYKESSMKSVFSPLKTIIIITVVTVVISSVSTTIMSIVIVIVVVIIIIFTTSLLLLSSSLFSYKRKSLKRLYRIEYFGIFFTRRSQSSS